MTSITTAMPLLAPVAFTWSSSEYSACHCRSSSSVSTTSVPRCASTRVLLRVGDVVAERILLHDELTRLAREQRVVLPLDAVEAGTVRADATDHRRRDRTRRIARAPTPGTKPMPGQLQRVHGLRDIVARPCGRDTRSGGATSAYPCRQSGGASVCSSTCSNGASLAASPIGSVTRVGSAYTVVRSIDIARSRPLRSNTLPRSAVKRDRVQREIDRELLVLVAVRELQLTDPRREHAEAEDQQRAAQRRGAGARTATATGRTAGGVRVGGRRAVTSGRRAEG